MNSFCVNTQSLLNCDWYHDLDIAFEWWLRPSHFFFFFYFVNRSMGLKFSSVPNVVSANIKFTKLSLNKSMGAEKKKHDTTFIARCPDFIIIIEWSVWCISSAVLRVRVRKPKFHLHNSARWFWIFHFLIYFSLHCRRRRHQQRKLREKKKYMWYTHHSSMMHRNFLYSICIRHTKYQWCWLSQRAKAEGLAG